MSSRVSFFLAITHPGVYRSRFAGRPLYSINVRGYQMHLEQKQYQIELIDSEAKVYPVVLMCEARYWDEDGFSKRTCKISTTILGKEINGSDHDFFAAFCRVREQLEEEGLMPMCYGASRNVFPSGMLRDMFDGILAYRLVMGQRVGRGDSVSIFERGPDLEPVSVQVQATFYRHWFESTWSKSAAEHALGADSPVSSLYS